MAYFCMFLNSIIPTTYCVLIVVHFQKYRLKNNKNLILKINAYLKTVFIVKLYHKSAYSNIIDSLRQLKIKTLNIE